MKLARWALPPLIVVLLLSAGGCMALGAAASALPKADEPAKYTGLQGQKVAVMVYVPQGLRVEFPNLQVDLAMALQDYMATKAASEDPRELKGTTFPLPAVNVLRWQRDYPQHEAHTITDIAPHIAANTGITRLIYVEVESFDTHSAIAHDLYRGEIATTLNVIKIDRGQASKVYEEPEVGAVYPPKCPQEGTPLGSATDMYRGSIALYLREVTNRFTTHRPPGEE